MYEVFLRLLELKNVSIAEVSRATGINQSVFSNWKTRKKTPTQRRIASKR